MPSGDGEPGDPLAQDLGIRTLLRHRATKEAARRASSVQWNTVPPHTDKVWPVTKRLMSEAR